MAVAHPMPSRDHRMSDATPRDHSFLRTSGGPRPGSIYAIVGPDGAGKTTIALDMVSRLLRRGIRTRISWMRSPRIVTLAVIGVLRLARLAKTVRLGGQSEVDQRVPGEAIADDRPPQQAPREGHLPEVPEEIIECDRPRVQVEQDPVAQIDV